MKTRFRLGQPVFSLSHLEPRKTGWIAGYRTSLVEECYVCWVAWPPSCPQDFFFSNFRYPRICQILFPVTDLWKKQFIFTQEDENSLEAQEKEYTV